MRQFIYSFFLVLMMVASAVASSPGANSSSEPHPHRARMLEASKGANVPMVGNGFVSPDVAYEHSWDQTYLEVVLEPHLADMDFSAIVKIDGFFRQDGMTTLDFNLASSATIHSIIVNGDSKSWIVTMDPVVGNQTQVVVDLGGMSVLSGDPLTLDVNYTGQVAELWTGLSYDRTIYQVNPRSEVVFTMAEPYNARDWLACYDFPGDKLDSSKVTVIMSPDRKVLSNGYLVADSVWYDGQDSLRTTSWFNPDPISTYLISIAASDYTVYDAGTAGVNNIPVAYWVYPEWYVSDPFNPSSYTAEKAIYDFGRTPQMIEMMEELFVPYPFNKYDQVMVPMGGAMEHQTATSMSEGWVGDGHRYNESVVMHELGHQWWGDYVGPHSFADIWLNEGFASYMEPLWLEYNGSNVGYGVIDFQENAKWADNVGAFPIYNPPPYALFSTTVYDKGASILHMLRWVVGDSNFFEGLRFYAQNHAYGSATTAEFQADMESVSGMDLTSFFNEWVYSKGYPIYRLNNWWKQQEENGTWTIFVDVSQEQNDQWSLFSTPLPITMKYLYQVEPDTTIAAQIDAVRRDTVSVSGVEFEPTRLLFNRDHWLMCSYTSELASVETENTAGLPDKFDVSLAWPNPFNGSTEFNVSLVKPGNMQVRVINLLGREVANLASGAYPAGIHRIAWNPSPGLASGVYLLQVKSVSGNATRKVTLVR